MLRIAPPSNGKPPMPPAGPPPAGPGGPPPELLAALAAASGGPGGPAGPPPGQDPSAPPTPGTGDPTQKFDAEKVSPDAARYLTPDSKCGSCSFFGDDGSSCNIVAGPIDPGGTCSLWTSLGKSKSKSDGKESPDDGSDDGSGSPSPDGQ